MDDVSNDQPGYYNQVNSTIVNPIGASEQVVAERDALTLDIDDKEFIRVANRLITQTKNFNKQIYNLDSRRAEAEKYLFGRQLNDLKLQEYRARYVDNIIYDSETYLKPMALSRMPDITVKPGNDTPEAKVASEDMSKFLSSEIQSRERKRVLGMAFKHLPVYFTGIIKYFWNPEKGKFGDFDFKAVHPENVVMDHTASSNDVRDMDFVAEYIEYTVKEWVMRFPKKEADFYKKLHDTGVFNVDKNENNDAGMNSKIKGVEIWFTWYEKHGKEYERLSCVGWFYKDLVFDRIKNPNWDWTGTLQTFRYDKLPSEQELGQAITSGNFDGFQDQTTFHNYFESPEAPYIFLGYDQWGKTPLDETSRIEQNIYKQQNLDKRGAIITDKLNRSRGKHIFSANEGLKAEDLEQLDLNNPDEDILVKGEVSKVHAFIPGEVVTPAEIQNLQDTRERIFATAGVNGPVRGQVDTNDVATTTQIAREGDFTRADDLTDDTINYACEKMGAAILQLIRLRYTQDHFVTLEGQDGEMIFKLINRDMVHDGMSITITSSGTDKLKAEQAAVDNAKLQITDPYSYYKDRNMSDPKGRTKLLMLWSDPNMRGLYAQSLGIDLQAEVQGAAGQTPGNPNPNGAPGDQGAQQAQMDISQIMSGQIPNPPQQVDAGYLQTFAQFMQSPQGAEAVIAQYPQLKTSLIQFAQAISQLAQQQAQGAGSAPQPNIPPGGPAPAAATPTGPAGPVASGNPSPGNTSRVNITPPARQAAMA